MGRDSTLSRGGGTFWGLQVLLSTPGSPARPLAPAPVTIYFYRLAKHSVWISSFNSAQHKALQDVPSCPTCHQPQEDFQFQCRRDQILNVISGPGR